MNEWVKIKQFGPGSSRQIGHPQGKVLQMFINDAIGGGESPQNKLTQIHIVRGTTTKDSK